MNPLKKLFNLAMKKFKKAVLGQAKEVLDPFTAFYQDMVELAQNPSLINLVGYFIKLFLPQIQATTDKGKQFYEKINNKINELEEDIKQSVKKKISQMIKQKAKQMALKALKVLLKVFMKFIGMLIKVIATILWPWGLIVIAVVALIFLVIYLWPSLSNLFSFSYGFNKADYYDTELFQAVKNKETMLENVYERTADTSYYQRFADSEIDDFMGLLVPNLEEEQTKYGKTYKEAAKDAQGGFTGFYTMDERTTAHDANLNPMQDIIQANTVDTTNENKSAMQGYFRDLFDKEVNFSLSEQFLRQANTYVQDMGNDYNIQLVYPEMFTKPIAYVTDFNRIDQFSDVKDNKLQYVWKDYTYTTKRVLQDEIGQSIKDVVRNVRELDYANDYYNTTINGDDILTEDQQGLIVSWPSPFVWEYAVYKKDYYQLYDDGTGYEVYNSRDHIVDNDYNNEYLTFVNDETGEVEQVKLFYKMVKATGASDENPWNTRIDRTGIDYEWNVFDTLTGSLVSWLTGNPDAASPVFDANNDTNAINSYGLLGDKDDYEFDGPYVGVLSNTYTSDATGSPLDFFTKVDVVDDIWYEIQIPEGYRLASDVSATFIDENGVEQTRERTKDSVKIRREFNESPSRHIQTVQLSDNNNNLAVSSQNLINYKYYKIKTVTEAYRNEQAYVDGWGDWIQDNYDALKIFSDKDTIKAVARRISSVGKSIRDGIYNTFHVEQTDLGSYSIEGTEEDDDLLVTEEVSDEEKENAALFNIIMDFPSDTLTLSLYLYEKDLVATKPENDVWIWDYSVNNYFKTDNKKLEGFEFYQKYYYLYEEAMLGGTFDEVADIVTSEYSANKSDLIVGYTSEHFKRDIIDMFNSDGNLGVYNSSEDNKGNIITSLANDIFTQGVIRLVSNNVNNLIFNITGKTVSQTDISDLLEKISGYMHTSYVNLGTVRMSNEYGENIPGFYKYVPNYNTITSNDRQTVVGLDIGGKNRGGEASLLSTFAINEDIKNEALIYSARNKGISYSDISNTQIETELKFSSAEGALERIWNNIKTWGSSLWGDETPEYLSLRQEDSFKINIFGDEHDHYQYDYYIDETLTASQTYRSGIFDNSGDGKSNELPLEVQSVRDYGLGSILNYVDSISVEFYSGAWYDEVYLKNEIGQAIISEYPDVYKTYSYTKDDWFKTESNTVILDATKLSQISNASEIVGSGYYPKEMKDEASDFIVELFEQNNKKKLFEQLVNSIDGKIFEVTDAYDNALWDETKEGKLDIDGTKYDLTDLYSLDKDLNSVNFDVDVVTDSLIGTTANFTLVNDSKNNIVSKDGVDWESYQIYNITDDESKFYYYMPEIVYSNGNGVPSKVAQLLIPKRYYRSWVKSLSLVDSNGGDWDEKISTMGQLELLRTLILRTKIDSSEFLKTYDDTLPSSNLDAIKKGISTLSYNIGSGSGENDYYAGTNNHGDLTPWKVVDKNEDLSRMLSPKGMTIDSDGTVKYYSRGNGSLIDTKPDKIYDYQGNEIKTSGTSGQENYYQYLLETYSSKNFKSGINRFDFITDSDVEKVFVIDEVATFTGKFMYTYKDTLLSTGDTLDINNMKGVLSAYATDRYIFLDSWDIKLLTERIIDVSFMFMNIQPTVDGKTISQFIADTNDNYKVFDDNSLLASVVNKICEILSGIIDSWRDNIKTRWAENYYDDFYSNVYVYAVPSKYINSINSSINWESDSQIRKEVEDYTNLIFTGFLFQESAPSIAELTDDDSFNGDIWDKKFDLLHDKAEFTISQEAIDAVGNAAAEADSMSLENIRTKLEEYIVIYNGRFGVLGFTQEDINATISILEDFKNASDYDEAINIISEREGTVLAAVMGDLSGEFFSDMQTMGNRYSFYISHEVDVSNALTCLKAEFLNLFDWAVSNVISHGDYPDYTFQYMPETYDTGFFESAMTAMSNFSDYVFQALTNAITGFKITSEEFSLCMKINTLGANIGARIEGGIHGLDEDRYNELLVSKLEKLENRYVKILGHKEISRESFDGFKYDYELTKYGGDKETGQGTAICKTLVVTYTLKCSDEIANRVQDGRYYSMFSDFEIGSSTDIDDAEIFKHIDDYSFLNGWVKDDLTSSEAYGELITVNSEHLKELFKTVYTSDANTLNRTINGVPVTLDYDKLWQPQVKLFDNADNVAYLDKTMKEILYGSYISNSGVNNKINIVDGVLNEENNLKRDINLTKVTNPDATKNWFLRFLGNFFSNREFLENTFDRTINNPDRTIDNPLIGFGLSEKTETLLFSPDLETKKEEDLFNDKFSDVDLNNKVYAVNPIDILSQDQQNELIKILNDTYQSQLKEIVNQGSFAVDDGESVHDRNSETYAITGFVLVPRFADRRDEPTLYPTYRYYGGSKKQIIPEEQIKYFEGLTYDSWKAKMTVNEESDEEDKVAFKEEMNRLSNYIYTYFSNFEAYVPYNIITDSDLEIRGTAGYADLLTQYTLYPTKTMEYTDLFVAEANKSYWNDICESYGVPRTVIAQLLQGIAETKLSTIAEDSAALLARDYGIEYSNELVSEINSKIDYIIGAKEDSSTNSDNLSVIVNGEPYPLPILGITAIDNIPDKDLGSEQTESTSSVSGESFAEAVFIGSVSDSSSSALATEFKQVINVPNATADTLISKVNEIPEDTKIVAVMPSVQDVLTTRNSVGNIETAKVRQLLKAITRRVPNAKIYYLPINPVVSSSDAPYVPASPWEGADILNNAIVSFNDTIKEFCNDNLDGKVEYKDGLESLIDDSTGGLNIASAESDKCSLNSSGTHKMINTLKGIIFDGETETPLAFKDTRYYSPVSSNLKDFEISLNIYGTKTNPTASTNDDRLDMKKAIAYTSLKLYKDSKSLGDLLKGVYASFYGEKFLKALVTVTDDNSINLAIDAEHGLWYRPTNNDIQRALDRLNESSRKLFDWRQEAPYDELKDVYGIAKLQKAFSYIKNMDDRKTLVTFAMNSNGGLGNLSGISVGDLDWDIGAYADSTRTAAEQLISGVSLINGSSINSVRMIDYIATICNEFSSEDKPLDPALVMALIMHESHGNPNIRQYGGGAGRGLAQHSSPGGLNASATTNSGTVVSINFPYDKAFDPIASIDYIVINFAGQMQNADYEMHPFTALRTHNLPTTLTARKDFTDKYPLTPEGDLQYIYDYETGENYEGYNRTMEISGDAAKRAAAASESEYKAALASNKNFGFSDPKYITHILAYYCEDYANGDLLNLSLSASNKRDYSEEIWEEEYLKYQNSGVELYSGKVATEDIDLLVQMTANYRNNNTEQNEYGYTYLDFFKNVEETNSGENKFTGEMGDSLLLNAMTYLGAHYSQGLSSRPQDVANGILYPRTSHAENMGGNTYNTPWGQNYSEGTFATGNKFAFDCSSFGNQMYIAMGYNLNAGTCAALNSKYQRDSEIYLGTVSSVGIANLKPGDLLVSSTHTIIWMGQSYANNYNSLFDPTTLRIIGNQIIKRSGTEVLSWANSNVSKNAYIHCGGYKPGGSCVNIKEGTNSYLSRFNVYRFFRDDVDYNQAALSALSPNLCPTIFTSTTIKNNPYLVQYMEDSGILESEMAKGQFTNEDVVAAKNKIASVNGEETTTGNEELTEEEMIDASINKKDNGYYIQ